ncbi:restriction endonuclease subunit S [Faecalimonas sp.]
MKCDMTTLGAICTKIGSGATPRGGKEVYKKSGISLIRSQNVLDFKLSNDGLAFIDEVQAEKLSNVEVLENDILLNITGDSVARACKVEKQFLPARVNQHVAIIRPDRFKANPSYILYFLQMKKQYLLQLSASGGTRNALTKKMIEDLEIQLPPFDIQEKIASILSALDDKIALNQQINNNLEQQAQAIYQQLFVDQRNPEWKIGKLFDLLSVKYGKDHKKLADGEYPVYGSGGIMRYVEKPLYTGESVLIPRKGTLNNVMYVNCAFWSVDTMFYTVMLRPNVAKFAYHFVKNIDLASLNAGSAVPSMTTNILNGMQLYVPDDQTLQKFEDIVSPMYLTIQKNMQQSNSLVDIRDTLLPKLMLGELDVSKIEL